MDDTNSGLKAYPALDSSPSPYLLQFSGSLLAVFCLVYCKNIREYSSFWSVSGCLLLKSGRNLAVFFQNSSVILQIVQCGPENALIAGRYK